MFRKVLFWVHLIAGVVAGVIIGIMCATGAILAFEHEIVEWAERDARIVAAPVDGTRLPLDAQIERAQAANPGARPTSIIVHAGPDHATTVGFGRDATYYVNPYTGEVRQPRSTAVHDFMHMMIDWHRWLAMSGDQRATGKAITGACNLAFLVLGITGLYLWWPRQWIRRFVRPALWFANVRGKARDWNWHNVVGFWSLPVLIVLTVSGAVISYRWASNSVYRAFGEQPPQQQGPGAPGRPAAALMPPAADAQPQPVANLLAGLQRDLPNWESIQWRNGGPRGAAPAADAGPRAPQPVNFTVRELDRFPTFATTTVTLDPFTGATLNHTGFAQQTAGRQARMWLRYLHVGQGFGWTGQLIALLACLGGLVLVYTGFALALRRLWASLRRPATDEPTEAVAVPTGD